MPKCSQHRGYGKTSVPPRRPFEKERIDQVCRQPQAARACARVAARRAPCAGALLARQRGALPRATGHPSQPSARPLQEMKLLGEYGLRCKREIWRAQVRGAPGAGRCCGCGLPPPPPTSRLAAPPSLPRPAAQLALAKTRAAARRLLTLDEKDPTRLFEGDALLRRALRAARAPPRRAAPARLASARREARARARAQSHKTGPAAPRVLRFNAVAPLRLP
jgi:hypothetical protein